LKQGDTLDLEINKAHHHFTVCAFAQPTGYFTENGQSLNAIVPKDTLSSIYGSPNMDTIAFVKLKEGVDLKQSLKILKEAYPRYTVEEPVSEEELRQQLGSISVGFTMMTVVVLFMSIFIIYTSFKVITMERLPVIGTFRSIGATRRTTDLVLLAESLMYGVIGGLLGCISGVGILYVITKAITPPFVTGYDARLVFTADQLVYAFILAVVLSMASSIIPIIRVSRLPVKDIVLNSLDKREKKKYWRYITGIAFLILSVALPPISPNSIALATDTVSMLLSVSGIILLIPLISAGFVKLFEAVYTKVFGNIGVLAAKNIRQNKNILNNISLLAIGISSLIMITTISDSVMKEVSSFFTRNAKFEILLSLGGADRSFEPSLLTVDGVRQIYGVFETGKVKVEGKGVTISLLQGVTSNKHLDFMDVDTDGDKQAQIDELDRGRNIIITNMLKDQLHVKMGDTLTLKLNNRNIRYRVTGFFNSLMDDGNYALISDRYFKIDTGIHSYDSIYIKTNESPDKVVKSLKEKYIRMQPYITTMSEMEKMNYETNSQIFNAMKAFAVMTLVIGIFGIINNYMISFLERRRSLAMYRSVGMSRVQIVGMMFVEALSGGFIGGALGAGAGLLMVYSVPYVMKAMNEPIPLHLDPATFLISFLAGTVITLVASVSPTIKSSKLKLIEALKYE
jgi:putative ABC transport system permease protein